MPTKRNGSKKRPVRSARRAGSIGPAWVWIVTAVWGAVVSAGFLQEGEPRQREDGPLGVTRPWPVEGVGEAGGGGRGGRVAIIIDNLGDDEQIVSRILDLDTEVTLAVLPYRRHSREVAEEAHRRGREVLLHLPLEPWSYPAVNPGPGCLLVSMGRGRIQAELDAQIDSLVACDGVNNHMGSRFSERARNLRWVLAVLRERGLFYVDSLTTPASVAGTEAREVGVPYARRTHFIGLEADEVRIIGELCRLADSAARRGRAVGVCHPSQALLDALPKALKAFEVKGIEIVPASQLTTS